MRKIAFVTSNKHKLEEMQKVLLDYDIKLEQIEIDYPEDKEKEMEEIVLEASKNLSEKLGRDVIVEDTGLYFEAYHNFPGAQPKFVYNTLGFKGILKLLDKENRNARFKTIIGYCSPGKEPRIFTGEMKGVISEKVYSPEKNVMPYDHIFVPEGLSQAIVDMSLDAKNSFSQRGIATRKFGEFIKNSK